MQSLRASQMQLSPPGPCAYRPQASRRPFGVARAGSEQSPSTAKEENSKSEPSSSSSSSSGSTIPLEDLALPRTGYFSIANPKAEVYSRAGDRFDPTQKGGRFKPEFIWNTNWQEALKLQEDLERQQREYREQLAQGKRDGPSGGAGTVSLSRLSALDDVSVDLSQQLREAQRKAEAEAQRRAAQQAARSASAWARPPAAAPAARPARQRASPASSPSYQFKDLPTRGEARRFERATRIAGASAVVPSSVGTRSAEAAARRAEVAAAERAAYEVLKREFQQWTLAAGALGAVAAYAAYSRETAVSYGVGVLGGLVYLRLLSRSVDSVGEVSLGAGVSGAAGQQRLLIPVILTLGYNRWNTLFAVQYGLELQLIPMLLGFFTYKMAVLARQGLVLLGELSGDASSASSSAGGGSVAGGGAGDEAESAESSAMTLDRIFVRKVMSE